MSSLPLPLPLPLPVAKVALVGAFLLHIIFVNLTVGGTLIALHTHWRGRQDPEMLGLAKHLIDAVTVHKSVAVVLGVGPLLLMSIAYTEAFYTSSVLIAPAWLSVIWMVTLAFGLLYGYKFGWNNFRERNPRLHGALGVLAAAILLCVPLIYLANTNLMLDRAAWLRRPGFFEVLGTVGNVFPRYVHFMLASLAISGFWIALWWRRPSIDVTPLIRAKFIRTGVWWALIPTALQFLAGPVVLFTLPTGAINPAMLSLLAIGILCGALALFSLADSLRGADHVKRAALLLLVTIICMGTARHLIREALLERSSDASTLGRPHDKLFDVKLCNSLTPREKADGHQSQLGKTAPPPHSGGAVRKPG
jgi:cytochrome c